MCILYIHFLCCTFLLDKLLGEIFFFFLVKIRMRFLFLVFFHPNNAFVCTYLKPLPCCDLKRLSGVCVCCVVISVVIYCINC